MAEFPGTVCPWVQQTFVDSNGDPLASGTVAFKVTGTEDDKDTFSDAQMTTPNANPVVLDADGRPSSGAIFFEAGGYDVFVYDADEALVYSVVGVEDVGATFLATMGQTLAEGEEDAADGYVITDDDNAVSGLPVAGGDYYLPAVSARGLPLTFINKGAVSAYLAPDGSDTVNGAAGLVEIVAGTSPLYSGITLYPKLPSNWVTAAYWTS